MPVAGVRTGFRRNEVITVNGPGRALHTTYIQPVFAPELRFDDGADSLQSRARAAEHVVSEELYPS